MGLCDCARVRGACVSCDLCVCCVAGLRAFRFACSRLSVREKYCTYPSAANRFSSKQAKFLRPQRKSTVRAFQSRPETMAPFIEGRWGQSGVWEGGIRERRTPREGEREKGRISCFTSVSQCHHSPRCLPRPINRCQYTIQDSDH